MEMEYPSVLDASDSVSKAITEISRTGLPVIVTKDGRYFGLIDERTIRQRVPNPGKEKCDSVAERTPTLSPESTVMDACNAFFAGRFKAIPVVEKGKVQGAITRHTLLDELLTERMLSKKRVSEVMTSPVAAIEITASVGQARAELRRHNIRRLVVTEKGKIAGLLSVFDLASFVSSPKQGARLFFGGEKTSMDSNPIAAYIKTQVETIPSTESLASAVKKMLDKRMAALIVSEGSSPVGIVTAKDIMQSALAAEKQSRVFVSGLPYEQRDYYDSMAMEGEKLLERLGKSFAVSSLALHIKKEGSSFGIRGTLLGKRTLHASASDFKLETALHKVIDELRKMAEKEKLSPISKRIRSSKLEPE